MYFNTHFDGHNARAARMRSVHYASRRSLVSLRIRWTSRVMRTLLSSLNVNLSTVSRELREFGARLTRAVGCRLRGHAMFSAYRLLFSYVDREQDGQRLALSEISRCWPHKSTVDTAVARTHALTRSTFYAEYTFGRYISRLASLRLAFLRSILRLASPLCSAVYVYWK